jgi:DNA-binding NarL/FixJ family response regulator
MLNVLLVEDNPHLSPALKAGLEATGDVSVIFTCDRGEEVLEFCLQSELGQADSVILMDVQLTGSMNGIQAAVAIRREFPRFPVVFYSIQDDDRYFRDFRSSGILSHYVFVRKSNYLLPAMLIPLLKIAVNGGNYIDPEIAARVQEVQEKDEHNPLDLLEPNEREVARLLADGLTNEQIASRMGFRDKRTISRINGQIYRVWGLNQSTTDEKIARTRAAIILHTGKLLTWDDNGEMIMESNN